MTNSPVDTTVVVSTPVPNSSEWDLASCVTLKRYSPEAAVSVAVAATEEFEEVTPEVAQVGEVAYTLPTMSTAALCKEAKVVFMVL